MASVEIICPPVPETSEPTKVMGEAGGPQAKAYLNKFEGGRQSMRIYLDAGFDWRKSVSPMLPGCPEWCPATHFGYLESGEMGIQLQDGTEYTIKAGETYFVPPGHLPKMTQNAVMVEFSQDTTYTNEKFLAKEEEKKE